MSEFQVAFVERCSMYCSVKSKKPNNSLINSMLLSL